MRECTWLYFYLASRLSRPFHVLDAKCLHRNPGSAVDVRTEWASENWKYRKLQVLSSPIEVWPRSFPRYQNSNPHDFIYWLLVLSSFTHIHEVTPLESSTIKPSLNLTIFLQHLLTLLFSILWWRSSQIFNQSSHTHHLSSPTQTLTL